MLQLEDHSTGELWPDMSEAERVSSSTDAGDLHWVGAEVVAASGGLINGAHASGHIEMYAPSTPDPGSSVSHFSDDLNPNELMEPFETGALHDVGLALELFVDLGWFEGLPVPMLPVWGPVAGALLLLSTGTLLLGRRARRVRS